MRLVTTLPAASWIVLAALLMAAVSCPGQPAEAVSPDESANPLPIRPPVVSEGHDGSRAGAPVDDSQWRHTESLVRMGRARLEADARIAKEKEKIDAKLKALLIAAGVVIAALAAFHVFLRSKSPD